MLKESDRGRIKGLMQILDSGTFPLRAKEVSAFYSVYKWAQGLEDRIQVPENVEKKPRKKK